MLTGDRPSGLISAEGRSVHRRGTPPSMTMRSTETFAAPAVERRVRERQRRSRAAGLLVALLLVAHAACGTAWASARRVAVVVGISRYAASTGVAQLPACEMSARRLADVLSRQADTRSLIGLATVDQVLDAVSAAATSCAPDDVLLLFFVAAGDDRGVLCSDGCLAVERLRRVVSQSRARHRVIVFDTPAGGRRVAEIGDGDTVALASTSEVQRPAKGFFPFEDCVRFESAASHGWARALEQSGSGWRGDLGNKGCVSVEDLRMCGDEDALQSLPHGDGRRALDAELGLRLFDAVRPTAARSLRDGSRVELESLRTSLGKVRFQQLAGVIDVFCSDAFSTAEAAVRRRVSDALARKHPMSALQAVHDVLARERLLDTPPDPVTRAWKHLHLTGGEHVQLVLPSTQTASMRGHADVCALGTGEHARYPFSYGTFEGRVEGAVQARLRLELLGSCLRGHWEGVTDGRWLRGDWQGLVDARTGKTNGRILSHTQPMGGDGGAPADARWLAVFEGTLTREGLRLSGTWTSAQARPRIQGRWSVLK